VALLHFNVSGEMVARKTITHFTFLHAVRGCFQAGVSAQNTFPGRIGNHFAHIYQV